MGELSSLFFGLLTGFMNKLFALTVFYIISIVLFPTVGLSAKPSPPLSIRVTPVRSDISPDEIKPGDVVDFKISCISSIDVDEMRIDVELTGGAALVSGDTVWIGPAEKGEEKSVLLRVRVPDKGDGRISARASFPSSRKSLFSAEADYLLGPETKEKQVLPSKKKTSRGRDIIEYE